MDTTTATITVVHVPHDETAPVTARQIDNTSLATCVAGLEQLIGGGCLDEVTLDPGTVALFDQDALHRQPLNHRATSYLAQRGHTNSGLGYWGDAVFLSLVRDNNGDIVYGAAAPDMIAWWEDR